MEFIPAEDTVSLSINTKFTMKISNFFTLYRRFFFCFCLLNTWMARSHSWRFIVICRWRIVRVVSKPIFWILALMVIQFLILKRFAAQRHILYMINKYRFSLVQKGAREVWMKLWRVSLDLRYLKAVAPFRLWSFW